MPKRNKARLAKIEAALRPLVPDELRPDTIELQFIDMDGSVVETAVIHVQHTQRSLMELPKSST